MKNDDFDTSNDDAEFYALPDVQHYGAVVRAAGRIKETAEDHDYAATRDALAELTKLLEEIPDPDAEAFPIAA